MKNPVPIGSICSLQNGRAFKPEEWSDTGTPIVRIQNLNDESKPFNYCPFDVEPRFHIKTGDLLFSWSGTLGTSFGAFFWNRGKGFLNQHIFRVDVDESRVSKDYLRHALNAQLPLIMGQAHGGVGLQHITKGKLEAVEVLLPPLPEQRRIAAILNQSEALRAKRLEALDQLDSLTQSILIEMFGDPITNPKGYPITQLKNLVASDQGITYGIVQRGEDCEDGVPVLRISDVVDGEIRLEKLKKTAPEISERYSRTILKGGELAISIRGTVGRCAIVPKELAGGNISREVALIPIINPNLSTFLLTLLRNSSVQSRLAEDIRGVAQSGINLEDLRELAVIQPPQSEVNEFTERLAAQQDLYLRYKLHFSELEMLFASLQHRAFQGAL